MVISALERELHENTKSFRLIDAAAGPENHNKVSSQEINQMIDLHRKPKFTE